MLIADLFNAVWLYDAYFLPLTIANAFCIHALSCVIDTVRLLQVLFCATNSAFNQFVFLISCSHRFLNELAMGALAK